MTNQLCNRAHLFGTSHCRRVSDPVAPDVESPELLLMSLDKLQQSEVPEQFRLASHIALLAIATHPRLSRRQ